MAKFEKGKSGNPKGRPQGSKNKNCMNPVFWWNMLDECLDKANPADRIQHVFRALELLMPKVPTIPATQQDSAQNAGKAFELMNGLAPQPTPTESNGNGLNGAQ